jgi:hypothetical protein
LMIFTKKDKKYWDNIYWDGYWELIVDEYSKTLEDLKTRDKENQKFEEF